MGPLSLGSRLNEKVAFPSPKIIHKKESDLGLDREMIKELRASHMENGDGETEWRNAKTGLLRVYTQRILVFSTRNAERFLNSKLLFLKYFLKYFKILFLKYF